MMDVEFRLDIQKKAGLPAVEVVFTILHAGGKFGGGGYKVSGGLHGVGASVVNALSEWLEVNSLPVMASIYNQRYERGKVMYPLTSGRRLPVLISMEPELPSFRIRRSSRRPFTIMIP